MDENTRNALEWIRFLATVHYLGGAFDPEHMRNLANLAIDALNGTEVEPFRSEEYERRAREIAAELSSLVD